MCNSCLFLPPLWRHPPTTSMRLICFADLLASKPHMPERLSRFALSCKRQNTSFSSPFFAGLSAGVGIAERGLRSLFKEYVQGDEEEMRRPRSRGGTGLGLSICSKQVRPCCRGFLVVTIR